ncbi:MAG TPA: ferritin-like domain-containing protein [Thermoleophilaceae bacterium]|nr:ferritin-like domain-containing protein [Thermoleophilaceae bacterium]
MFEKLNNPREVFGHKLGSALTMEQNVLKMLGDLEDESQRDELKQQFRHHADETRQQIANIEQSFRAMGEEPDDSPCQAIKGLEAEAKANIKMADESVLDDVILAGAAATEHHEIAVYETLIAHAEELGEPEVVQLLQQNLEQEQHTLEEVARAQRQVVHQAVATA